jgi:hypothetical protein
MQKLPGVTWNGLDSFKRELQVLTSDLVSEAEGILVESAFAAGDAIRAAYPYVEGALQRGVTVTPSRGMVLAGAELTNTAPHAYLYEHGTKVRANKHGDNRGQMKGTPTFIPIAAAYREHALQDVIYRIYQHGASSVTGEPDGD